MSLPGPVPHWTADLELNGTLERYLPQKGEVLAWTGPPAAGVESLYFQPSPGILHPARPRLPLFNDTGEQPLYDLLLVERLQGGLEHASQVWLCEAGPHKVVLKLAYSLGPTERPRPIDADSLTPAHLEFNEIGTEAVIYDRLVSAQGSIVPHSYALWKNGHFCYGFVMEYIDAPDPKTYLGRDVTQKARAIDYWVTFHQTVLEMHKLDVVHKDYGDTNLLVYDPFPRTRLPRIVLLVFDLASELSEVRAVAQDQVERDYVAAQFFVDEFADWIALAWLDPDEELTKLKKLAEVLPEDLPEEERGPRLLS